MEWLKKIFCMHRELEPCVNTYHKYVNIQGTTVYYRCKRCGKVVRTEFLTWDEQLAKFGKYI